MTCLWIWCVMTRWDIALECYLGKLQSPPRNQSPPGRVLLQVFEEVGQLLDLEHHFNVKMIDSLGLFWDIFVAISWKLLWRQTTNIICANNKIQTYYLVTFETGSVYLHRSLTVLEFTPSTRQTWTSQRSACLHIPIWVVFRVHRFTEIFQTATIPYALLNKQTKPKP